MTTIDMLQRLQWLKLWNYKSAWIEQSIGERVSKAIQRAWSCDHVALHRSMQLLWGQGGKKLRCIVVQEGEDYLSLNWNYDFVYEGFLFD